ncbi:MAG: AAA family ATPase [Smithellaceae bacterium]|nr:AAA family ATPase [Smithellaceae bacterium]
MEYFNLLQFKKEPFSNSPEPEFLFTSPQHNTCLQGLELAVRLRRGLNIVIGAVGTGKTTLCRKFIQDLSAPAESDSSNIETFLLLDPAAESRLSFVKAVASVLGISDISGDDQEWQIKEKIKRFLFEQGVQDQKNIVLIIDEGQKIPDDCLEILREFLNYETNSFKLLQIVIFAQPEFRKSLAARANLLDRVNYLYHLQPLSFWQTRAMIKHRISFASQDPARHSLLTFSGMLAVYVATAGYPRKVVSLCHQILLMLIISGKSKAGWFLVRNCVSKTNGRTFRRFTWVTLSFLMLAVLLISTVFYLNEPKNHGNQIQKQRVLSSIDSYKGEPFSPPPAELDSVQTSEKITPPAEPDRVKTSDKILPLVEMDVVKTSEKITPPAKMNSNKISEKIPDYLGKIAFKKRMTIWQVLHIVYGEFNADIKRLFIAANPQIKNVDYVHAGAVIQVPSIQEKAQPLKKNTIIVSLENGKELETIYYSFIEKKDMVNMPALLLLSFWNKREGKQFSIALDERFTSIEAARDAIRRLPAELAASAQILSQWDGDIVFFNKRFLQ